MYCMSFNKYTLFSHQNFVFCLYNVCQFNWGNSWFTSIGVSQVQFSGGKSMPGRWNLDYETGFAGMMKLGVGALTMLVYVCGLWMKLEWMQRWLCFQGVGGRGCSPSLPQLLEFFPKPCSSKVTQSMIDAMLAAFMNGSLVGIGHFFLWFVGESE